MPTDLAAAPAGVAVAVASTATPAGWGHAVRTTAAEVVANPTNRHAVSDVGAAGEGALAA